MRRGEGAGLALGLREAALDGELVYLTVDGFPDFHGLRQVTRSVHLGGRLYYQVFDLLNLNGADLTCRPLMERKARLMDLLRCDETHRLRYVAQHAG